MDGLRPEIITERVTVDGKTFTFQSGRLATQANGAVEVRLGDTIVLATAVSSKRETSLDYFPLSVEYQEKLYAGGKIKGSRWVKREGRPSDEAILTARLIDRSLRPLFPKDYRREVQIIVTVLSVDGENDPDIPALLAASAALAISDIPWQGPVAALRVGLKDGHLFANPVYAEREFSDLDLIISGKKNTVVMVEAGAKEVSEEAMSKAFGFAQERISKIIETIEILVKKAGKPKQKYLPKTASPQFIKAIQKEAKPVIEKILKEGRQGKLDASPLWELEAVLKEKHEEGSSLIGEIIFELWHKLSREQILKQARRPDGRRPEEIRPLKIEVGILPRTHGSAIFQRGSTQALTITTLGSPSEEQLLETMEGEASKRYIHHYFMPPYSVGETGRLGWPSRREVGHGALAERALEPMIPPEDKFPYTIRVVSEITSSNGSTSMASVCGSTLSLMDAGVPIKKPVAGIAMGLIINQNAKNKKEENEKEFVILTDILGEEDHLGDMDFKVAGTADGITALQMDIKVAGINQEILTEALSEAKKARLFILGEMLKVIGKPRPALSKYAPRIAVLHIDPAKIGEVIGSGGKTIRHIINTTGCSVDVEDDGSVTIAGNDPVAVNKALTWIDSLTRELQPGEIFEGTVKRLLPFGAFVEVLPGREGLVHLSHIPGYPARPEQVLTLGQKVKVRVREIDEQGRVNLSMLFGQEARTRSQFERTSFNQPRRPRRHDFIPGFKGRLENQKRRH